MSEFIKRSAQLLDLALRIYLFQTWYTERRLQAAVFPASTWKIEHGKTFVRKRVRAFTTGQNFSTSHESYRHTGSYADARCCRPSSHTRP